MRLRQRIWLVRSGFALGILGLVLFGCTAARKAENATTDQAASAASPVDAGERGSNRARRVGLEWVQSWQLNLPGGERFDASGLFKRPDGTLLTVNDREAAIYRIELLSGTNAANLVKIPECFTPMQLAPYAKEKLDRYDIEGVAGDELGRLYLCEEANRWILRWDATSRKVERLDIDWAPVRKYFHPTDHNASFEGIALGGGRIYVANERQSGRIIVVDQKTLKVIDDFMPRPSTAALGDIHYSDLSWFEGHLYALLRHHKVVLEIEPSSHTVLAEFTFGAIEDAPDAAYRKWLPTGTMEGLAVDKDFIWLATDNNGFARVKFPKDIRPTLFKCRRPGAN